MALKIPRDLVIEEVSSARYLFLLYLGRKKGVVKDLSLIQIPLGRRVVTHKLFGVLNQMVVRERKFPSRKQVELWGDHLRILECLPAWSVPC